MAFEEIKAKLGLDVTDFERGVSKAQGALGNVVGQATKKFTDFKQIGQTLATAVGFNLESISEGLARMIVGFSKQQETALLRLVDVSKTAADEMAKIAAKKQGLDDPKKRIQLLDRELESVSQQAKGRTKLTLSEKLSIINQDGYIAGITKIIAEEENLAKSQQDAQIRIGQISRERFSAQMEIDDEAAKKSKDNIKEVAALNEQTNKIEEESRQKTLTLDQKIAEARAKVEKPISVATSNVDETAKKQAQEKLERAKAKTDLANLLLEKKKQQEELNKTAQDAADKEKAKTAELEKQTGELRKQIKVKQDDINNSRRQAELPTMADVISGKRNIGGFGKSTASKLEKARAKELQLSDAEQRAREAYAGATTGGAKDAALAQGRGIRTRLDQTRGQIKSMEKRLGYRISDANPYGAMINELSLVKAELVTLNTTTLASTSTK